MPEQILTILFLLCSGVCWFNVRAILRDKAVAGVSIMPAFIFLITNSYEVWYFGITDQPLAAVGSVVMSLSNVAWIGLALFYSWASNVEGEIEKTLDLHR